MQDAVTKNQETSPPKSGRARSLAPVFVLGCNRSDTKFLYHTLLSAGGFAIYHEESAAFCLFGRHFGNLVNRGNRRRLLDAYFLSRLFHRTELDPKDIEEQILENCRNAGDFLRIVMEAIASKQGVERWAECTPLHLLYIPLIKKLMPDALIVHIIRDGRDVAASLHRMGWIRALPWDRSRDFLARAIFWGCLVERGRRHAGAGPRLHGGTLRGSGPESAPDIRVRWQVH